MQDEEEHEEYSASDYSPPMDNDPIEEPAPALMAASSLAPQKQLPHALKVAQLREGIAKAFDASQPVNSRGALRGRDDELSRLLNGVLYRKNHAMIYGPRGSGKTSLVRIFGDYSDQAGLLVIYTACSPNGSVSDLLKPYLEELPDSCFPSFSVEKIRAQIEKLHDDERSIVEITNILEQIVHPNVVFIFDEFDRVTSNEVKAQIASLLKYFSDARLSVKIVLVGIARDLSELLEAHQSLRRHMTAIEIRSLTDTAIGAVLDSCAEECGFSFDPDAQHLLTEMSCGSPYHARLFGMHAAFCVSQDSSRVITIDDVQAGLRGAFLEWRSFNTDVADLFCNLARARDTDRLRLANLAKLLARNHDVDVSAVAKIFETDFDELSEKSTDLLNALSPAIEVRDDLVSFLDATAAQFLLAAIEIERPNQDFLKEVGA